MVNKTIKELREMAKKMEVRGYSKMNKQDLINAITEQENNNNSELDKVLNAILGENEEESEKIVKEYTEQQKQKATRLSFDKLLEQSTEQRKKEEFKNKINALKLEIDNLTFTLQQKEDFKYIFFITPFPTTETVRSFIEVNYLKEEYNDLIFSYRQKYNTTHNIEDVNDLTINDIASEIRTLELDSWVQRNTQTAIKQYQTHEYEEPSAKQKEMLEHIVLHIVRHGKNASKENISYYRNQYNDISIVDMIPTKKMYSVMITKYSYYLQFATVKQINALEKKGWEIPFDLTKLQASQLMDRPSKKQVGVYFKSLKHFGLMNVTPTKEQYESIRDKYTLEELSNVINNLYKNGTLITLFLKYKKDENNKTYKISKAIEYINSLSYEAQRILLQELTRVDIQENLKLYDKDQDVNKKQVISSCPF